MMAKKTRAIITAKELVVTLMALCCIVGSVAPVLGASLTALNADGNNNITPGDLIDITGTGYDNNSKVTVSSTVNCWKPIVDGKCQCTMEDFVIPANTSFDLSVRRVLDNVTLVIKWGIWWTVKPGTTSFFLFDYNPSTSTSKVSSKKIPPALAGTYSIDVLGRAVPNETNCTMITTAKIDVYTDATGNFSLENVNTQGIPICNFTISATDGTNSASTPLNVFQLGDASKDGQVNAYDCAAIARYWAGIPGYDDSSISKEAAEGLAGNCSKVELEDARCLARYLIGWEDSIPCGCT